MAARAATGPTGAVGAVLVVPAGALPLSHLRFSCVAVAVSTFLDRMVRVREGTGRVREGGGVLRNRIS